MLTNSRSRTIALISVLLISVACGKSHTVNTIELTEVEPSYKQTLILKNGSQMVVKVIATPNSLVQSILITPGHSTEIQFRVKRLAQVDQAGNPVATTWTAMINGDSSYVGMQDTDGLLQIQIPNGEIWNYLISLGECWFDNNPPTDEHTLIIVDQKPDFGIPVLRLCE